MFTEYTGNRQFDLQLNRTFAPILDRPGMDKVAATTLPRLRTTKQITALAQHLADRFESEGDADAAWRLYELAAFYLGADDPRKHRFIDAMSRSFDEAHRGLALTRHAVPYRGGQLTAMRWEADPADRAQAPAGTPTTLVMMNGFDGYAEEIIDFASHFPTRPFDIITFDGPGQGHTAAGGHASRATSGNSRRRRSWTTSASTAPPPSGSPSAATSSCAPPPTARASRHVIAFDMMYRLLDGLTTAPASSPIRPHRGLDCRARPSRVARRRDHGRSQPTRSADLAWKLQQARHLTGLDKPSDVLRALAAYTMEPLDGHDPPAVPGDGGRRGPVRPL